MKSSMIAPVLVAFAATLVAQEPQLMVPQKEHELLQRFVGDWETEAEASAGPDQPAMECHGKMHSRALGQLWIVTEVENNMMGTTMRAVQTIGFDPQKRKYVGTWVDSVMNHLWKYEGSFDEASQTLTLEAEGPNMISPGETGLFRDVYIFMSPDQIDTQAQMQQGDEWITFATGTAKRKAAD